MSSWFRTVDQRMHGDEKYLRLTPILPSGRSLFQHLLICEEHGPMPGVIRAGAAALAETLEWSPEQLRERFQELFREGLAEADWRVRLVFLPNAIKFNPPNNPNIVSGWAKHWDALPEGALKAKIWRRFHQFFTEDAHRREALIEEQKTRKASGENVKDEIKGRPDAFLTSFLRSFPEPHSDQPGTVPEMVPPTVPETVLGRARARDLDLERDLEQEQGEGGVQRGAQPEIEPLAGGASSGPSPSAPAASRAPSSKASGPATAKTRAEPAAKKRARSVTPEGAAQQLARFPDLDVPDVREAMSRWLAVAGSEGPPLSPAALEEQLRKCAEIGPVRAVSALLNSAHKRLRYVVEAFGSNGASQNEPTNGNGAHPAPPANAIPPPGLRFKPEKIGGVWYITATDTGISHSRSSWPARWGPWRLTPENWKAEQWGPCPENLDDDPREELRPRREAPRPQPPPGLTAHA